MSLRARLLARMVVVSFVLIAAAVIIARTTQSNLVDRVDQQLAAAPPGIAGGGLSNFFGYQVSGGSFSSESAPTVRTDTISQPAVTVADAVRGAQTGEAFTVSSESGSGRFRMLARRLPDGSI